MEQTRAADDRIERTRRARAVRRGAWRAAAGLVLILWGCSTNPATGKREIVIMSTEKEKAVGEQASRQVAAEMGLMEDPTLTVYVTSIGKRLAMLSPRKDVEYTFHVVDLPEPNAFALPGGHIYVSRGLLALTNSEDELANVIGHEIAHVAARHQAQRDTRSTGIGVLATVGTIAAAVAGSGEAAQAMGQLSQAAAAGLLASYGRDQEREADSIGQDIAAKAGWNPSGMGAFLRTLGRETELRTGEKERRSFLDSHPTTPERVDTALAHARTLTQSPPAPIAGTRLEFLARIEGVKLGEDPAAGIFRGETFLHPELDLYMSLPDGWQLRNEPTAFGGISPKGGAFIKVEIDSDGFDAAEAATNFLDANGMKATRRSRERIGDQTAYQAVLSDGAQAIEMTWIPHRGQIFRVSAACPVPSYDAYKRIFERSVKSFRPLTEDEKRSIVTRRLYTAEAREGETIETLSKRTDNAWSIEETAVANAIFPYDKLSAGQFVKIAVQKIYEPKPPKPAENPEQLDVVP
jgi:predicted Zn-dependent protease